MGEVDEATAIRAVHAALDRGITLIDTAQGYRSSESILGKALQGGYRDRCFLATKVSGDYEPQAITAAMENSLRAMRVDHVDLYQIHFWHTEEPMAAAMETMSRLQEEGKTRFIGVSNFSVGQMREAMDTAPIQTNQLQYNLFDREIEAGEIAFCEQNGIGILAHSVLAKGLLGGKYKPDHLFEASDERSGFPRFQGASLARYLGTAENLKEVAGDKGLTLVQLAIAWVLQSPAVCCALMGPKTPEQVEEQLGALDVTFTENELSRIDACIRPDQ
jgi:aryl-alcohol dehydrogenase-like predicted oxidoreductase